jgi:hypothetical protein
MPDEISVLLDVVARLERAGIDYMLTGSMARNMYVGPRMTNDIDLVAAIVHRDIPALAYAFPETGFYRSDEAIRNAVLNQSSFNLIHIESVTKIDVMVRKREEFRLEEFSRRQQHLLRDHAVWVVSKEDLILSKLDWARDSLSQRHGICSLMGATPPSDIYPDTGYSVKDTSPEVNRIMFEHFMAMTPGQRLEKGCSMLAATKELILAGLPSGLTVYERRRRLYETLYGEPLPPDFPL